MNGYLWLPELSRRLPLYPNKKLSWQDLNMTKHIMILGVGNILFSDEGFGIRVIEKLQEEYEFPDNLSVMDGGVLGLNLLGAISRADHLIVVDAIRNKGKTGDLYRLEGSAIPERIRAKNSLHQIDFLEALTMCQALDNVPETVILGVEPADIETIGLEMTPLIQTKIAPVVEMVLTEIERLGIPYEKKNK
jgi:hydrogenase maturation protease